MKHCAVALSKFLPRNGKHVICKSRYATVHVDKNVQVQTCRSNGVSVQTRLRVHMRSTRSTPYLQLQLL